MTNVVIHLRNVLAMNKPRLLDLFCGAGGAAVGYSKAGFEVVGVDINPQPNYPFEFIQADAVQYLTDNWTKFDAFHASPPCQKHTKTRHLANARNGGKYPEHPDFIEPIRGLLEVIGDAVGNRPWVIENVHGAPLLDPISLYGSQFGLKTQRRRCFESNKPLTEPENKMQKMHTLSAGNGIGSDGSISICGSGGVRGLNAKQIKLYWGYALGGVDWMSRQEMAECIPPVYAEFIGKQLIKHIPVNSTGDSAK